MNYCPKCGKPLTEGATFCMNCGAKVDVPSVETSAAAAMPQKKRSFPLPAVILIILAAIVFGVIKFYPTIQIYRISGTYEQPSILDGYDATTIQLNPDMTATYSLLGSYNMDGFWTYDDGKIVLTTTFLTSSTEDTYAFYKNHLVDIEYIYWGSIPSGDQFDATLSKEDDSSKYVFSSDGNVIYYTDDNKTYNYTYTRDKDYITLTSSSGDELKYLILKDGIGSVYYTKP